MMRHNLPPPIDCRTTVQILRRTTTIFYSHLLNFLLISFLLFHFRRRIEEDYDALITGNAPSIEALLSRFRIRTLTGINARTRQHHHVNALYNDIITNDPHLSKYFEISVPPIRNSSFLGPQIILPENFINKTSIEEEEVNKTIERSLDNPDFGFKLSGHDVNLLKAFLFNAWYVYTFALVTVVVIFSWLRRAVLFQVASHLLGNHRSCIHILFDGLAKRGLRNILRLIYMKWIVMAVLALFVEFVSSWYKIQNMYMVLVVFLRAMYDPIMNLALWVEGPERENVSIILWWLLVDLILGFIFSVGSWVVLVDGTTNFTEMDEEVERLHLRLQQPARNVRILEAMICGSVGRVVLRWVLGRYSCYALGIQCVMEVYFMVAWLVYYGSARARLGRTMGRNRWNAILTAE